MSERRELLKWIKAPSGHVHTMEIPEITFMGSPGQPDFGELTVTMTIRHYRKAPELRSVKEYIVSFRDSHVSYERLISTVWDDFQAVYAPITLFVQFESAPRGGISSTLHVGRLPD